MSAIYRRMNSNKLEKIIYDETVNWCQQHIQWSKNNQNFMPDDYTESPSSGISYTQILSQIYGRVLDPPKKSINNLCVLPPESFDEKWWKDNINFFAQKCYYKDTNALERVRSINRKRAKQLQLLYNDEPPPPDVHVFLLTIGFDHVKYTLALADKAIRKILQKQWILRCKANLEMYRKDNNGEIKTHPHVHFYIETKKSKKDILYDLGISENAAARWPAYLNVVSKKNFCQVDPGNVNSLSYILLNKKDEKMECVQLDMEYRQNNNVPNYEKNW